MDLAQKASRVKRDLQAAAHKPDDTSIRHAIDAFDAFVDGVVEEIGQLKSALKNGVSPADGSPGLAESVSGRESTGAPSSVELLPRQESEAPVSG